MSRRYNVFPGQFIISSVPSTIVTVLGSCVAVCLYDSKLGLAGMNHYLLPGNEHDEAGNPNRGLSSTRMLIRSMLNRGSTSNSMIAKVFGGCNSLYRKNDLFKVGERNVAAALLVLEEFGIEIKAQHVGGCNGRRIVLDSSSGKVRVHILRETCYEINEEIDKGFGY